MMAQMAETCGREKLITIKITFWLAMIVLTLL
jgi:hypothetical protein